MSLLFSTRSLPTAIRQVSKLAAGSAIVLTVSGFPAVIHAQTASSGPNISVPTREQILAESFSPAVEEKIGWLDEAVLSYDNTASEDSDSDKIYAMRTLARSYSSLGSQTRAIELLDRAVTIAQESESRYLLPVRIIPTYIEIGEIETAEDLRSQAMAPNGYIRTDYLIDIVDAYSAADRQDLALATLSQAVDHLEFVAATEEERSLVYSIGEFAQAYDQLNDKTATEAALSRLVVLIDSEGEAPGTGTGRTNGQLVTALSQLSIAQSNQGKPDVAEALVARAMALVRDGEKTGYITAEVARAYGYLEDTAVSEQALPRLTQLAIEDIDSTDPIGPVSLLSAVAIAYEQIGNTAKSEAALAIVTDKFEDPYMLGAILGIYLEMDNDAGQEATIQKMFDWLPLLREAEFTVSDVTAGYSGISGLVEAYIYTADDALAQERLALLESFFTEVHFDPLYIPGQLAILARAAAARGDDAAAQRLLAEATQRLETDIDLCGRYCVGAINRIASSYTLLENEQVKQTGFNQLQQIANDSLDTEQKNAIRRMLIRARAAL